MNKAEMDRVCDALIQTLNDADVRTLGLAMNALAQCVVNVMLNFCDPKTADEAVTIFAEQIRDGFAHATSQDKRMMQH